MELLISSTKIDSTYVMRRRRRRKRMRGLVASRRRSSSAKAQWETAGRPTACSALAATTWGCNCRIGIEGIARVNSWCIFIAFECHPNLRINGSSLIYSNVGDVGHSISGLLNACSYWLWLDVWTGSFSVAGTGVTRWEGLMLTISLFASNRTGLFLYHLVITSIKANSIRCTM